MMSRVRPSFGRALSLLLACLAQGCGLPAAAPAHPPAAGPAQGAARVQPEYGPEGRLTRLSYDKDNDGKPDTWGFMDGARVVRVEVDENADGRVDRWEFHGCPAARPTGCSGAQAGGDARAAAADREATPDKTLERIERATRRDGRINRTEFFEDGALDRVEEDTDADGKIDKWERYKGGTLASVALDTQRRGSPDRRLIYADDGSFMRVEGVAGRSDGQGTTP